MFNLYILIGLSISEVPRLFGGGCVVQNNHLIITGAFIWPQRKLAQSSFKLNLSYIEINNQQEAQWTPVYPVTKIPGDMTSITLPGSGDAIFYIPGGYSKDYILPKSFEQALQRRQNDEDITNNIFGDTNVFKKIKLKKQQIDELIIEDTKAPLDDDQITFSPPLEDFISVESPGLSKNESPINSYDFQPLKSSPPSPIESKIIEEDVLKSTPPLNLEDDLDPYQDFDLDPYQDFSEIYLQQLENNIRSAVFYKNQLIFLENLHNPLKLEDPLKIISVYDYNLDKITAKSTSGEIPVFKAGFTVTQAHNKLYITGGIALTSVSTDSIYILNLDNFHWEKYQIPGLKTTKNGCLHLHNHILIHSFGQQDKEYSSATNLIDTKTWSLVSFYNSTEVNENDRIPKSDSTNSTNLIIIIASSTIIGLLLIVLTIFLIYRFRQSQAKIKLPQYHQEAVWADSSPPGQVNNTPIDFKLNDDDLPSDFYDTTELKPLSLSNTTQINPLNSKLS